MAIEYEFKYSADILQLERIFEDYPGPWMTTEMETTYYDTGRDDLARRKWALRRRMEGDRSICTLKTPAEASGARNEWEVESADISEALELLCAEGAPRELLELAEEGLVISCGARFTRCSRGIKWFDGTEAELALDKGLLWGGTHREPLCEVELELKAGNEATLEGEAVAFARRYGLVPQPKGKFQRARDLRLRGE